MSKNIDTPRIALAIGAHPDDIDFQSGATLAKWAADGCEVHYLVLTDGSKGTWDPADDQAALIAKRRLEQRQAYRVVTNCDPSTGEERTHFLDFTDGELCHGSKEVSAVCAVIRQVRPDVVLAHDPWKRYRLHPDHRNAGFISVDAIVAARDPFFYPEQRWTHFRPDLLLLFEADEIDHGEDVENYEERKIKALMEHKSQLLSTMDIDPATKGESAYGESVDKFKDKIVSKHREYAAMFNLTKVEAYKLMSNL